MPRIADFASNSALIGYLIKHQTRLQDLQTQVSTQKKSTSYAGLANQSQRLVSIENNRDLLSRYVTDNGTMDLRLKITDSALSGIETTLKNFRTALMTFQSQATTTENNVKDIQQAAFGALLDLSSSLNTGADNRYIFSGARVNTPPVELGLTTLADFQAKYDGDAVLYPATRDAHVGTSLSIDLSTISSIAGGGTFDGVTLENTGTGGVEIHAEVAGSLAGFAIGSTITLTGSTGDDRRYTVVGYTTDVTGDHLVVSGDFTPNGGATTLTATTTFNNDLENITVGSITADSYYRGDSVSVTQKVSQNREFTLDTNAADPTFEKAIRALSLIAEGQFGTAGGLDAHPERVEQALYLLRSALDATPTAATPPFGTEQTGSLDALQVTVGYQRLLIDQTNQSHNAVMSYYDDAQAAIEDINPTEVITRLLSDQQALEAAYQAFARIRQLSLADFMTS